MVRGRGVVVFMDSRPTDTAGRPLSEAQIFLEQVLRTGFCLGDLMGDLIEMLSDGAYPDEDKAEVVLEMIAGTITPVIEAAGDDILREATSLLGAMHDRVLFDLRRTVELAAQLEADRNDS